LMENAGEERKRLASSSRVRLTKRKEVQQLAAILAQEKQGVGIDLKKISETIWKEKWQ